MHSGLIVHPEELSKQWVDRLASVGIETLGIHPRGGEDAVRSLEELHQRMKTSAYRALIDYARSRGLRIEYEMHAAGYLLPRELFSEHPEYFRQNKEGERTQDHNLCVSSPDALELYAHRAAELACELYGGEPCFYFWMDDGYDLHCHCDKCKQLSASDQQMLVLNRVLREIRKHVPNAKMAYLAYMDTMTPPSVRPEEGIFLEYAPFQKYTAKGEGASLRIREEEEMLAPLMECFPTKEHKVLEYWYDNSLFSGWKKPPRRFLLDEETMRREIAAYRRLQFDRVASFACYLGEDYEALYGDGIDVAPFADATKQA